MLLTLDSSVVVAALRRQEADHEHSLAVLGQVATGKHQAIEPLSVLVEVVAAIRRRTESSDLARRVQRDLLDLPHLRFLELDRQRAQTAAECAVATGLRGMDAIVVAIAREFGSALVTLDVEIQQRAQGLVEIVPVGEAQRAGLHS